MNWQKFTKYKVAFDYIIENRPMHIVEYGGGQSTYFINQLLDELDYGGRITAYENNPEFYEISNNSGWNVKNSIKLVDLDFVDTVEGVLRYVHPIEDIQDVDFIIIDGPDYRLYEIDSGGPSSSTDNIKVIYDTLNREIPFWIEGRSGCQRFYKNLNYSKHIIEYEI